MYQEETIFARKYAIASYGDVHLVFEGSLQADTYGQTSSMSGLTWLSRSYSGYSGATSVSNSNWAGVYKGCPRCIWRSMTFSELMLDFVLGCCTASSVSLT